MSTLALGDEVDVISDFVQYSFSLETPMNLQDEDVRKKFRESFKCRKVSNLLSFFVKRTCTGLPEGMEICVTPTTRRSRSPGSRAIYPAYWDLTSQGLQGGLLLQVMIRPLIRLSNNASPHYHKVTIERFYPIAGSECQMLLGKKGTWEPLRWRHEVAPNTWHLLRIRWGLGVAINVIRMDTPHHVLCRTDHYLEGDVQGKSFWRCPICG